MILTSLPDHILLDITSYLDNRTLKALSTLHSSLREVCEIHLFRSISLPLSNPYLRSSPVKPYLANRLEGYGWKDDHHQTSHLDASLRYLTPLLAGKEGYVKELAIDLKYRYHDPEIDLDELTNPSHPIMDVEPDSKIHVPDDKSSDPPSELDLLRLKASLIRQRESPSHLPHLARTFASFPILPGVRTLKLTLYESFPGYLPYLFPLFPNLTELILEPHGLLVESPLTFGSIDCPLPRLKTIRVEPMMDSLKSLVEGLLREGRVEEVILGSGRWTMDEDLSRAIKECKEPKRF